MKKSLILVGLISAFIFSGCSNNDSAKKGEEIQKLIDKTGWTIERPKGGTAFEDVSLVINDKELIIIDHDIEKNVISSIYFIDKNKEYYSIVNENGTNTAMHKESSEATNTDCYDYDLDKNKESSETLKNSHLDVTCSVDNVDKFQEIMKSRDQLLKEAGITMDDLYSWGKWYFENNK